MILAFAGKAGVGKTTLCSEILNLFPGRRVSFADPLRREVAEMLGVEERLVRSPMFKEMCFRVGTKDLTGREILQWWGADIRRAADPCYWTGRMASLLRHNGPELLLIDDVRFGPEAELVRSLGGILTKIEPHLEWKPGPNAGHESETALDDYTAWHHVLSPDFGELPRCAREMVALLREHTEQERLVFCQQQAF